MKNLLAFLLNSKNKFYLNYVVLGAIPVAVCLAYTYNLWWWLLAGFLYSKTISIFGTQIGLHRYFAHKSFKTNRIGHIFLTYVSILTAQSGPVVWANIHNYHHMHSDTTRDIHSPVQKGFWYVSLFWYTMPKLGGLDHLHKIVIQPNSWSTDKHVAIAEKYYLHIWLILATILTLITWKLTVFILLFGGGLSLFSANCIINGLSHIKLPGSYRNYETQDNSYNNKLIQMFFGGEGLHNNHHRYPGRYSQAIKPGERDVPAWFIKHFFLIKT
jgi:stearoyl-CoA desaturase (delta-9 desaturase)